MSLRRLRPALLALLVGTGCRALGVSDLSRPPAVAPRPTVALNEAIDRHNRNAERVTSLEAEPSVSFAMARKSGSARGNMALERPRNFRLQLEAGLNSQVADVGSNSEEFWFWVARQKENAIYVGQFDRSGELPPELIFQPDWIIEALGMHVIADEERDHITLGTSKDPNRQVWVHSRSNAKGETTLKKTVVDRVTGEVFEHVFYAPDGQTILARAETSDYRRLATKPAEGDAKPESVVIPQHIRLTGTPPGQESFTLDIRLTGTQVNTAFNQARRDAIFTVPHIRGTQVVNINERLGAPRTGATTIRETRPAPASAAESRVRLGEPEPVGIDGAARTSADPLPLTADLTGIRTAGGVDAVVGARMPRPPGEDSTPR